MSITIQDIISNTSLMKDEDIIYAKKIDGKFFAHSEVAIIEITEEEQEMLTSKIAQLKCPGFEYFLESFIIKDMIDEINSSKSLLDLERKVEIIIHYAEFDA